VAFSDVRPRGLETFKRTASGKIVLKGRRGVSRSAELIRVSGLARRSVDVYNDSFALALSMELRRPGSEFVLRPKQAAMLVEAVEAGGSFCMTGTGEGKTTVAPLFGKVLGAAVVVMLVPPALKIEIEQRVLPRLHKEIDFIPPRVVSYSELSTAKGQDVLDRIKPDLIIADEAHLLRNKAAARTKRFLRYFAENPTTMLVALSGTMTRRSVMDFFHILQLTHKDRRCPLTRSCPEAKEWSLALDPQVPEDQRMMPGALESLCNPGETARDGFRRRLLETEGVVGGSAEEVGASLVFRKLYPEVPDSVTRALKNLRKLWETPGGEQISDAKDFARKARELAQGFYYVWDWPNGEPDEEWLEARKVWRKAVSEVCKLNRQGLDSELLVRNAAVRALGLFEKEIIPRNGRTKTNRPKLSIVEGAELPKSMRAEVVQAWQAWDAVREREDPPTRAVWIDDFIVRSALSWAKEKEHGIIWYESRAVEERVRLLAGSDSSVVVCGAGDDGNRSLLRLADGFSRVVVFASSFAHGTGKNLQRWSDNLVLCPWSGGATWEQTIARTFRPGQDADEVTVDVYCHTPELFRSIEIAIEQARYIEAVTSSRQKLLMGTWIE
jgi:hypothetical protein